MRAAFFPEKGGRPEEGKNPKTIQSKKRNMDYGVSEQITPLH